MGTATHPGVVARCGETTPDPTYAIVRACVTYLRDILDQHPHCRPSAATAGCWQVRRLLPLQWAETRRMDGWQAAYFAFYDLGIALGPVSRFRELAPSSTAEGRQVLFGSVASAVGAFIGGGLVAPRQTGVGRMSEVETRWRLVTDVTQRVCRDEVDRHDFWRHCGAAAWRVALWLSGLSRVRTPGHPGSALSGLPDEILLQIAQTLILTTFRAPPPPTHHASHLSRSAGYKGSPAQACRGPHTCEHEGKVLTPNARLVTRALQRGRGMPVLRIVCGDGEQVSTPELPRMPLVPGLQAADVERAPLRNARNPNRTPLTPWEMPWEMGGEVAASAKSGLGGGVAGKARKRSNVALGKLSATAKDEGGRLGDGDKISEAACTRAWAEGGASMAGQGAVSGCAPVISQPVLPVQLRPPPKCGSTAGAFSSGAGRHLCQARGSRLQLDEALDSACSLKWDTAGDEDYGGASDLGNTEELMDMPAVADGNEGTGLTGVSVRTCGEGAR